MTGLGRAKMIYKEPFPMAPFRNQYENKNMLMITGGTDDDDQ